MKNKILKALLSLAIALSLWAYAVTVVSPNSDRHYNNISVTLQGETLLRERGLMITTQEFPTVSLHLEGSRTDLDKLNNANIALTADVSKIYDPGTHSLRFTPTYPGEVASSGITVLSQNPVSISVEVEEWESKTVPVDVQYTGTLPEAYIADTENRELSVESVAISGPKSTIDQIAAARIDVDLSKRTESIREEFQYTLCDNAGKAVDAQLVTTDVDSITLDLRIAQMKEIALSLNVVDGGGATGATTEIAIEPATIRVSGSASQLEGLENFELGSIDLKEMAEDAVLTFPIKLPEGLENETGVTEATVTVKFSNLATKSLKITNFKLINVPKGLNVRLITQVLEVQMRGPKGQIDKLEAKDLVAVVDMTDAQIGTVKVNAQITADNLEVGAVGTYPVSATVQNAG